MGLFDTIYCKYPLPIPNLEKEDFQTKDLDCSMDTYEISEEGKLYKIIKNYKERKKPDMLKWGSEEYFKWLDDNPLELIFEEKRPILHHGVINFYTSINFPDQQDSKLKDFRWVEFDAYFSYGNLDKIEIVEDRVNSHE